MSPLVDTEMAAAALGSGVSHVQNLVKAGKLTNKGTARRIQIDMQELSDKLASGEIQGGRRAKA